MKSKLAVSSVKDAVLSQKALPICQLVATVAQSATVKANRSPGKVTSCIFQRLTGEIPASEILTSASLHDSLVAIPLMQMNYERLGFYCYYLMDSAYDAKEIHEFSRNMGRLPIINPNKRSGDEVPLEHAKKTLQ